MTDLKHPVDILIDLVERSGGTVDRGAFEEARKYYDEGGALTVTLGKDEIKAVPAPKIGGELSVVSVATPGAALRYVESEEGLQRLLEIMRRTDTSRPAPMIVREPLIPPPHNEHLDGDADGLGAFRGVVWAIGVLAIAGGAVSVAWSLWRIFG